MLPFSLRENWVVAVSAVVALLAYTGLVVYFAADYASADCERDTAQAQATAADTGLQAVQGLRKNEQVATDLLQGANDAYTRSMRSNALDLSAADDATDGLLWVIGETAATGCGGVPAGAATQRRSEAIEALATSLAECATRRKEVGRDLAQSIARHEKCVAEHESAQARTKPLIQ